DVTRGQLLEVGLVPPGPVGRLLGVRRPEDVEHLLQTLLAHDVADADEVDVLRRDLDGQVALGDLALEVGLLHAADGRGLDLLDERCPVVRVDNGLAYAEGHVEGSPFARAQSTTVDAPSDGPSPTVFPGQGLVTPARPRPGVVAAPARTHYAGPDRRPPA